MRAFAFVSLVTRLVADELHDLGPDQEVHHVGEGVEAVVGDEGGQAVLAGGGPRREEAAEAHPHERNAIGVDVRALEEPVDGRGDDFVPVRAEEQLLVTKGAALSGPGKGEHVVATSGGGRAAAEVQLLLGAVEAAVVQERGPGAVGIAAGGMRRPQIGRDPPPGQRGVLVGEPHLLRRGVHQLRSVGEAVDGEPSHFADFGVIRRVNPQVELAHTVVVARPQVGLPGADRVPFGGAAIGVGVNPFGERPPLGVPGSQVAVGDPARRAGHFADVGAAVWGVAESPERLEGEGLVVEDGSSGRCWFGRNGRCHSAPVAEEASSPYGATRPKAVVPFGTRRLVAASSAAPGRGDPQLMRRVRESGRGVGQMARLCPAR